MKHYWIRVKATGKVNEVTHEVMKFLRNEEKRMRREIEAVKDRGGSDLSYDIIPADDEDSSWLQDPACMEADIMSSLYMDEFRLLLTPLQLSVLDECILGGKSHECYAAEHGVGKSSVSKHTMLIKKKAKSFFGDGSQNEK